jgi:sugar/nucleoside kinase (ribokinase family)
LVFLANIPLELNAIPLGQRVGSKLPVDFDPRVGGVGANGAPVVAANSIQAHLLGVQSSALAELCRRLAEKAGLVPHLTERDDDDAAITVSYPSENGGSRKLLVQRCRPMTPPEVAPFRSILDHARALVVGPIPIEGGQAGAETVGLLTALPDLAPHAYCAIQPHPRLIGDPRFAQVIRRYHYVQMNGTEANELPVTGSLRERIAHCRDLVGEDIDFAFTNGARRGWTSADGQYFPIDPITVAVASDIGAGDVFCTAWVIARAFFGADAGAALDYALRAAATVIAQNGAIAPFATATADAFAK